MQVGRYCISWINFHDNELKMEVVETTSIEKAYGIAYCKLTELPQPPFFDSIETLTWDAFNADGMICALYLGK